jgi:cystathionine beta-synthase
MLHQNILEAVGHTPLVRLNRIAQGYKPLIAAKLEYMNPGGSIKDRIALSMVDAAEREGALKPGGTIIEGTSGNTGMGLALVAAVKGYRAIFTMPDKMSREKIDALRGLGADVVVTPTAVPHEDPRSYHAVAERLSHEVPNAFFPNQYDNPNNPLAHYRTTGPEIWEQTEGKVTHVVVGVGTGGTITGIGRYLKEKNRAIRVVGVDPVGSVFYDYFRTRRLPASNPYKVEGVGQDDIPGNVDFSVIDDIVQVSDRESFLTTRALARQEGIFAGGSSGMAMHGALQAARTCAAGDYMVVLLPDSGSRYLSKIYNDAWMRENQYLDAPVRLTLAQVVAQKPRSMGLIAVRSDATIGAAIELMRTHGISQVPVLASDRESQVLGSLDENHLLELLLKNAEAWHQTVFQFMEPPLGEVPESTPLEEITRRLAGCSAILVRNTDGTLSIITKSDLLFTLFRAERGAEAD